MGHGKGRGPRSLEIEASRNSVNVEHLTSKVKARTSAALQCIGVDGRKGNASTSDELIMVGSASAGGIAIGCEHINESAQFLLIQASQRSMSPLP